MRHSLNTGRVLPGLIGIIKQDILNFFFTRLCSICHHRLNKGEEGICCTCFCELPLTHFAGKKGNPCERLFWGQLPIERASAYIFYHRGANSRNILFDLKYYNHPEIGIIMGRIIASELITTGFFNEIISIIPIPLADSKKRQRGYNQCEWLAKGISEITSIPIDYNLVKRIVANPTQTHLLHSMRNENVEGIFSVPYPEKVKKRHFLLVDDVITTGATITSCGKTLVDAGATGISILSLAISSSTSTL